MRVIVFILLCLVVPYISCAHDFQPAYDICNVIRVVDGDTFKANCKFRGDITVRLLGIDTYESAKNRHALKQVSLTKSLEDVIENGKRAKQCLIDEVEGDTVLIELSDRRYGVYGRLLANVIIFRNGTVLNLADILSSKCSEGVYKLYK